MAHIGGRVRALRLERQLNLPALAEKTGLSKGLLSKLENAETPNPSLETLYKISEALGVTLSDILDSGKVVMKQIVPDEPPSWLIPLQQRLERETGSKPDEDILQALYVLQARKGSTSKDETDWYMRYKNLEMSFSKRT